MRATRCLREGRSAGRPRPGQNASPASTGRGGGIWTTTSSHRRCRERHQAGARGNAQIDRHDRRFEVVGRPPRRHDRSSPGQADVFVLDLRLPDLRRRRSGAADRHRLLDRILALSSYDDSYVVEHSTPLSTAICRPPRGTRSEEPSAESSRRRTFFQSASLRVLRHAVSARAYVARPEGLAADREVGVLQFRRSAFATGRSPRSCT